MANGKMKFGKQSGGTLGLVFPDGVSDTEVFFPESGELATKEHVSKALIYGGRDVYLGSYGLEWNETTDTYRRIGAENYTAIQSLMKRCVLNADGSVKYYLDPNNSNYKEDGALADLTGADGNVMVEVPKTYTRYEYSTTGVS